MLKPMAFRDGAMPGVLVVGMTADDDELRHLRQLLDDRVEHRHEVGADDQHLGLGVVDDELHLGRGEPPVDVDTHGVQHRRTEGDVEVLDAVLVEERHPVLGADAGIGERLRNPRRALQQLRPRE